MRPSARERDELRPITLTRNTMKHAEGSCLVTYGDTKVICTASVTQGVPRFLKGANQGWLTCEYAMLPRATHERTQRESTRGKPAARSQEIQRLIGRALRSCIDLKKLPEVTITIDCDVLQADGGTRTASITGAAVALHDAVAVLKRQGSVKSNPIRFLVNAVSVGIYEGLPVLDLDYKEDSSAETDMNVVMAENGDFIEIQGTAEQRPFDQQQLNAMLDLAKTGLQRITQMQRDALE